MNCIIFYDIIINVAQCASVSISKAEGSSGAILTVTYGQGGRIDMNLPEGYDRAFAMWQNLLGQLRAPGQPHQHGDTSHVH